MMISFEIKRVTHWKGHTLFSSEKCPGDIIHSAPVSGRGIKPLVKEKLSYVANSLNEDW